MKNVSKSQLDWSIDKKVLRSNKISTSAKKHPFLGLKILMRPKMTFFTHCALFHTAA